MNNIVQRKLLVEEPVFDLQYIVEEKNKSEPSTLFIQGPFLMSEQKNKNGRIYNLNEMVHEVNRYTSEMIKENRSLGELNHPASVEVNPERACHLITELRQEGNMFFGKSKILSTPMGSLVRALIMDNVKLGISSRALGKLLPQGDAHAVQGFHLICCDVVHDPSVSTAFVNGIMEAKNWILNTDGTIEEAYDVFERGMNNLPKNSNIRKEVLEEHILKFITSLKNSTKK
ncbi:MAG: primosomal protein [Clostridia bacterium]|nr:primosomal protein [Clostridia bacterium]